MTTYKEINGTNIEAVSSDPANPVTGQVWYNTTDNVLKGAAATTAGAWATGGNLNTARDALGSAGIQTSALGFGGITAPTYNFAITESYNGSSWTEVADLNTGRANMGGVGSSNTNALAFGGVWATGPAYYNNTETWNGSSWTEVANLNTTRALVASAGVSNTSALAAGGFSLPPTPHAQTELWNGSSWTEVADLNTGRRAFAGSNGTQTSALVYGGDNDPPVYALTESWNGSSWTEVADLNVAKLSGAGAGADNTSALQFGGNDNVSGPVATTELWNGSSWAETTDLSVSRRNLAGTGTQASALAFGGSPTTASTEEWTGAGSPLVQTFTDS
mgnify:CR=1 FL=1